MALGCVAACTVGKLSSGEDKDDPPPVVNADASLLDTSPPTDDSGPTVDNDGGSETNVPQAAFCTSHGSAAFCEDFENGTLGKVANIEKAPAGNALTAIAGTNSKFVMQATTVTSPAAGAYVRAQQDVTKTTTKFRFAYDVSLSKIDDTKLNELCAAWITVGSGSHIVTVARATGGDLNLRDYYSPTVGTPVGTNVPSGTIVANNVWTHIELTVDLNAAAPKVELRLNGNATPTTLALAAGSGGPGALVLKPGINYIGATAATLEV